MRKTVVAILILVSALSLCPLFAEDYYQKGNTMFSVRAGISVPAFTKFFDNENIEKKSFDDTNMKLGGLGSLSYQVFLSSKTMIGGELGYGFNYSQAKKILTTVPLTVKFSFVPVQTGKFDLILSANGGVSFSKYDKTRRIWPYLGLSVMPEFYFNTNWGLGLDAGIWFGLDLYTTERMKKSSSIGSMIPITCCMTYRK